LVALLVGCLVGWLVLWLVRSLICWLDGWFVGWYRFKMSLLLKTCTCFCSQTDPKSLNDI